MIHIVIVSHSKELANAVVHFVEEMKGEDDFKIIPISGIDGDEKALGSDPIKILNVVQELVLKDEVLLLGDIGSSIMNMEMALEMLSEEDQLKAVIADAPLVEGALSAVSYNHKNLSLKELKDEVESVVHIKKLH